MDAVITHNDTVVLHRGRNPSSVDVAVLPAEILYEGAAIELLERFA